MLRKLAAIVALSVSPLIWVAPAAAQAKQQPSKQKAAPKAAASLSGCLDQQDGQYVLMHQESRATIANLEADGFPTEGFAKHVGQKVTVRGTSSTGGTDRPVFKVRSVQTLSDSCAPADTRD